MITVTGTYRQPDDTPSTGSVVLELVAPFPNTADPRLVTQGPVVCVLDDHGHFTTSVVASDDPGWTNGAHVPYRVIRRVGSGRMSITHLYLDGPGPVDITQVTPISRGDGCDPWWWGTQPATPTPPAGGLVMADLLHAAPVPYDDSQGSSEGAVVLYQGIYWVAKRDTNPGQSPTSSPGAWISIALDDLARKAAHAATQSDVDALALRVSALEAKP